jgi:hypothetical protein
MALRQRRLSSFKKTICEQATTPCVQKFPTDNHFSVSPLLVHALFPRVLSTPVQVHVQIPRYQRLQVHEKSFLMPALPLTLLALHEPQAAAVFLPLAAASMFPLLQRDGQGLPCLVLTATAALLLPVVLKPLSRSSIPDGMDSSMHAQSLVPQHMTRSYTRGIAEPQEELAEGAAVGVCLEGSQGLELRRGRSESCTAVSGMHVRRRQRVHTEERPWGAPRNCGERADLSGVDKGQKDVIGRKHFRCRRLFQQLSCWTWEALYAETVLCLAALLISRFTTEAPTRLPYLHDALLSAFCFIHFQGLFLYATWRQLTRCLSADAW